MAASPQGLGLQSTGSFSVTSFPERDNASYVGIPGGSSAQGTQDTLISSSHGCQCFLSFTDPISKNKFVPP